MKVSTTSLLLASLYGSALAAPVSGDLVGGALKGVTSPAGLTKGLTGAVGQPGSVAGRAAPIGGNLVGGALGGVTSPAGLGNVAPGNGLTKGLTGAVGQPGSIVSRDGEQKATAILPNGQLVTTDHTAGVDIRADAPNVHARNVDAKAQPFAHPPADVNVDARNLDAKAKGVVGQLVDSDDHTKVHPFAKPPVDVNDVANVDARNVAATSVGDQPDDAVATGVAADDDFATATGSAEFAGETGTYGDVSSPTGGPARPTGSL